jgi:hypothetical protein
MILIHYMLIIFLYKIDRLSINREVTLFEKENIKLNVLNRSIKQFNDQINHYNYIENGNKTNYNNYTVLNRKIISLCYNWNLDNMEKIDHYYLKKEYIKMINNGSVIYIAPLLR